MPLRFSGAIYEERDARTVCRSTLSNATRRMFPVKLGEMCVVPGIRSPGKLGEACEGETERAIVI